MMDRNIGNADRIIRIVLGLVLVVLSFYLSATGAGVFVFIGGIGLGILMFVTAAINFCPLYTVIGFRSLRGEK